MLRFSGLCSARLPWGRGNGANGGMDPPRRGRRSGRSAEGSEAPGHVRSRPGQVRFCRAFESDRLAVPLEGARARHAGREAHCKRKPLESQQIERRPIGCSDDAREQQGTGGCQGPSSSSCGELRVTRRGCCRGAEGLAGLNRALPAKSDEGALKVVL